jgi:hypothetical protein
MAGAAAHSTPFRGGASAARFGDVLPMRGFAEVDLDRTRNMTTRENLELPGCERIHEYQKRDGDAEGIGFHTDRTDVKYITRYECNQE